MRQMITTTLTLFAILLFSPIVVLIAVCVYLEDRGKVFFLQDRIGLREIPFQIIKFRSMKDGNVTKVGSVLRQMGLDELPQLFNILMGDMSIIGPRPLTKFDINRLGLNQYKFIKRFSVKPGLTGLAQIYAGKNARITRCFDFYYLRLQSLSMDMWIILITLCMNIFGKNRIRNILWKKLKLRKRNPSWKKWLKYFKQNTRSPIREKIDPIQNIAEEKIIALRRSLAVFQLGESGEGRIAKQIESVYIFGVNETYRECLKLFVKEEGKHAKVLAVMVRSLGGKLLKHNWTESIFIFGRRILGIRLKLLVLLVAEVVGVTFYKLFVKELPLSGMRATLIEIIKDEESHIRFHSDFFIIRIKSTLHKMLFRLVWRIVTLLAFLVVLLDHRKSLAIFDIPIVHVYEVFFKIIRDIEKEICNSKVENRSHYPKPVFHSW